ncbi:hypothetical protein FPV67DRAFT_1670471 [Lyophyllum atratum]|nr:hypothetical protein FPV67DRAFT_1670471 [Lyophyllum atratum]
MKDNSTKAPEGTPTIPVSTTDMPLSPPPALTPVLSSPKRFPSPPLILMSVLSCFLATAALSSAIFSFKASAIVPSAIAFCFTVPYHVYLYLDAQKHRRSSTHSDPIFVSPNSLIYGFLLVPLWVFVFVVEVLVCTRSHGRRRVPVIVASVWNGLEWMTLLFIVLKCAREILRAERVSSSITESQPGLIDGENTPPTAKRRRMFLASFILCTLTLVVILDISLVSLANLIAFLITAPYHIAIYASYLRPRSPTPLLARRWNVSCALLLAALWCWVFVLNILLADGLWRRIVSGIFGGLEGVIVVGLAARAVLESFDDEQIKL